MEGLPLFVGLTNLSDAEFDEIVAKGSMHGVQAKQCCCIINEYYRDGSVADLHVCHFACIGCVVVVYGSGAALLV